MGHHFGSSPGPLGIPPWHLTLSRPLGLCHYSRGSPIGGSLGRFGLAGLGLAVPIGAGVVIISLHWYWRSHLSWMSTFAACNGIGGTRIRGSRHHLPGSSLAVPFWPAAREAIYRTPARRKISLRSDELPSTHGSSDGQIGLPPEDRTTFPLHQREGALWSRQVGK